MHGSHYFRVPGRITMNAGGEVFSVALCEELDRLGITTENEAKGAHASVFEESHRLIRVVFTKLQSNYPHWDNNMPLIELFRPVNKTIGAIGHPANQAVLGSAMGDFANTRTGAEGTNMGDNVIQNFDYGSAFLGLCASGRQAHMKCKRRWAINESSALWIIKTTIRMLGAARATMYPSIEK